MSNPTRLAPYLCITLGLFIISHSSFLRFDFPHHMCGVVSLFLSYILFFEAFGNTRSKSCLRAGSLGIGTGVIYSFSKFLAKSEGARQKFMLQPKSVKLALPDVQTIKGTNMFTAIPSQM